MEEQNNERQYNSKACNCYSPQEVVKKPISLITDPTHITYRNSEGNIYLEIPVELINGSGTNS